MAQASGWQPSAEGLAELVSCLRQTQAPDTEVQRRVRERIEQFHNIPDFPCYLAHVLVTPGTDVPPNDRAVAGYLLQTAVRQRFQQLLSAPPVVLAYLKVTLLNALLDPDLDVRRAGQGVIAWMIRALGPEQWPESIERLVQLIEGPGVDDKARLAAFGTIARLCEDMPKALETASVGGQRLLDILVPRILEHVQANDAHIRQCALQCLIPFITLPDVAEGQSNALVRRMHEFLPVLFGRATDPSSQVRKLVCQALVGLLGHHPSTIMPQINGVVDYVLHCTQDQTDPDLALEACEFWLTFAETPELAPAMRPFLDRIAPVLLNGTVYEEDELFALDGIDGGEDSTVPDRAEDIKPKHYGAKAHTGAGIDKSADPEGLMAGPSSAPHLKSRDAADAALNGDDDDDEYEEDEDDEEDYSEWTLRKCSAAALDVMAVQFEGELLPILLPLLKTKLWSEDWLQRESAILALGAIAEGCIAGIQEHLPVLTSYLISCFNDSRALVRSIACWALGRYASWTVNGSIAPEHKATYFVPALEGLLRMVLDSNKRVQEAGCSAFATLEEEAGPELEPYLQAILNNLVVAFTKYQQKNLMILYDAIGTLADSVGASLNEPTLINILMPPLIAKWQTLHDDDPALIPLLECMSSVVIAIASGFEPFTGPVFERCVRIVQNHLVGFQAYCADPNGVEQPDKTFLVVALDLLSGLTQGLTGRVAPFFESSQAPVFQLLQFCLTYPEMTVRQSAYALVGDCAISIFPQLKPVLPHILPDLINQIETEPKADAISVCNNAAWAAGEIALKFGAETQPYVEPLMARLVPILLNPKALRSLNENSAVTVGRLGLVCPNVVAPHLEVFITPWCQALAEIKDNDEKDSAFRGICMVVKANPNGITKSFAYFLNAVGRWQRPSPELASMFRTILTAFKEQSGAGWPQIVQGLPNQIAVKLHEAYGV